MFRISVLPIQAFGGFHLFLESLVLGFELQMSVHDRLEFIDEPLLERTWNPSGSAYDFVKGQTLRQAGGGCLWSRGVQMAVAVFEIEFCMSRRWRKRSVEWSQGTTSGLTGKTNPNRILGIFLTSKCHLNWMKVQSARTNSPISRSWNPDREIWGDRLSTARLGRVWNLSEEFRNNKNDSVFLGNFACYRKDGLAFTQIT